MADYQQTGLPGSSNNENYRRGARKVKNGFNNKNNIGVNSLISSPVLYESNTTTVHSINSSAAAALNRNKQENPQIKQITNNWDTY